MTNTTEQPDFSSFELEVSRKRTQKGVVKKTSSTRKPIQLKERAHTTFIEQKAQCGFADKTNEDFVLYLLEQEQKRRESCNDRKDGEEPTFLSNNPPQEQVAHWKSRCDALAERLQYVEQLLTRTEIIASNSWKQKIKMEEEWKMCQATLHEMAMRESEFKIKLYEMEKRLKVALDSELSDNSSNKSHFQRSNLEYSEFGNRLSRNFSDLSSLSASSSPVFSPAPTLPIIPMDFTRASQVNAVNSYEGVLKLEPKSDDETFLNSHRYNNTCFEDCSYEPAIKKMKLSNGGLSTVFKQDDIESFFSSIALTLEEY